MTTIFIKNDNDNFIEAWPFEDGAAAKRFLEAKPFPPEDREKWAEIPAKYRGLNVVDMTERLENADWKLSEWYRYSYDTKYWVASNTELDESVVDEDWHERRWAARFGRPQDLDLLVKDENREVRASVAEWRRPQDLDVLVHDQDVVVRMAVAGVVRSRAHLVARPQDLDILVKDPEKRVRMAVARNGRPQDLDILVDDKSRDVRKEVADRQRPQDLAKLASDDDPVVSKTVAEYLKA